jgi:hypothetical protein
VAVQVVRKALVFTQTNVQIVALNATAIRVVTRTQPMHYLQVQVCVVSAFLRTKREG